MKVAAENSRWLVEIFSSKLAHPLIFAEIPLKICRKCSPQKKNFLATHWAVAWPKKFFVVIKKRNSLGLVNALCEQRRIVWPQGSFRDFQIAPNDYSVKVGFLKPRFPFMRNTRKTQNANILIQKTRNKLRKDLRPSKTNENYSYSTFFVCHCSKHNSCSFVHLLTFEFVHYSYVLVNVSCVMFYMWLDESWNGKWPVNQIVTGINLNSTVTFATVFSSKKRSNRVCFLLLKKRMH